MKKRKAKINYINEGLSKNLSSANININITNTRNDTNKYILPKISLNKGEETNEYLTVDMGAGQIGTTNDTGGGIYNESDVLKNNENNEEKPHVVKVYRKNKLNSSEINKKS